jgi:hypothetical protein
MAALPNNTFNKVTTCPHCKIDSFHPILDSKTKSPYTGSIGVIPIDPSGSGVIFARALLEVVFKNCTNCGYIGTFSTKQIT